MLLEYQYSSCLISDQYHALLLIASYMGAVIFGPGLPPAGLPTGARHAPVP